VRQSHREKEKGPGTVTEMAIVDTFTKLIFGDEDFSDREATIIEALRSVNPGVHHDDCRGMGEYLRGLGVPEMVQLVSRVRQRIAEHGDAPALPSGRSVPGAAARPCGSR
jgi:hypothetical protein